MRRWLVLALVLLPALASAQSLPGSPFFGSGGSSPIPAGRAITCTQNLSTTSATSQTVATITTTTGSAGTLWMFHTVNASNGTQVDTEGSLVLVAWNNASGTVSAAITATIGPGGSDGSGTLTNTPTVTAATNVVSVKIQPTWTTIVPTLVTGYATFLVNGVDPVICQ